MTTLFTKTVTGRKDHRCGLCGAIIPKGEKHELQRNKYDDDICDFRCHLACKDVMRDIWEYVDPDDGMTEEEFCDAVYELIHTFYCPFHCKAYNKDTEDCECGYDVSKCIPLFHEYMKTHSLDLDTSEPGRWAWKMNPIEKDAVK